MHRKKTGDRPTDGLLLILIYVTIDKTRSIVDPTNHHQLGKYFDDFYVMYQMLFLKSTDPESSRHKLKALDELQKPIIHYENRMLWMKNVKKLKR